MVRGMFVVHDGKLRDEVAPARRFELRVNSTAHERSTFRMQPCSQVEPALTTGRLNRPMPGMASR
jgi:hypothetical protein